MIRLGILLLVLGIVIVIVAVVAFALDRAARNTPLNVAVFPGAELVGSMILGEGHDQVRYRTPSPAEEVAAFYINALGDDECVRIPPQGDNPNPGEPAFSLSCAVDHSSLNITQRTLVTVQPGIGPDAGMTLIEMDRLWGQ